MMKTFTLRDADGVDHKYEVMLHPASEGVGIMWQLLAMAAPALGAAVKGFLGSSGSLDIKGLLDDPEGLTKLGGLIDFGSIGADVGKALLAPERDRLVKAILSKTSRDGQRLENMLVFDQAFGANYGELVRCLWGVVQANRFLSLLGTSQAAQP